MDLGHQLSALALASAAIQCWTHQNIDASLSMMSIHPALAHKIVTELLIPVALGFAGNPTSPQPP